MDQLSLCIQIAAEAHAGQVDKAGEPYILHPLAVMLSLEGEIARCAAALHDVVEDCPAWSMRRLVDRGVHTGVLFIVDLLTKRPGQSTTDYLDAIRELPIARAVKLADIAHNSLPERLARLPVADAERLRAKYDRARQALS